MAVTPVEPDHFPWFRYAGYTFSLGLTDGDRAWLSGHSASEYDPDAGRIVVRGGMAEQARTAYAKIGAILDAAGMSYADVVRVVENVTVAGIDAYAEAAAVRREVFGSHRPAVGTVVVEALLRPAALLEVEVTARRGGGAELSVDGAGDVGAGLTVNGAGAVGPSPARAADDVVYLPTALPVGADGAVVAEGDLVGQTAYVFEVTRRRLAGLGLGMGSIVKTLDYTTPATLGDYKRTARVRRDVLSAPYPGSAGILMSRLHRPGVLVALDVTASRAPLAAVNPGWERYAKLTYSPAVRAGNVLFMSGQAALDPATERAVHPGDVAAQADYTYANILAVLAAAGMGPEHLVKTVEYVTPAGLPRYREVAAVRERVLRPPWPSSTGAVCHALLRPEFEIEVDPLAVVP